jgi:hypothetical protein
MNSEWFSIPVAPRQLGDEQREAFVLRSPHFGAPRPDCLAVYVAVGASAARYAVAPRQPSAAIRERVEALRLKRKAAPPPYPRPAVDDEDEA